MKAVAVAVLFCVSMNVLARDQKSGQVFIFIGSALEGNKYNNESITIEDERIEYDGSINYAIGIRQKFKRFQWEFGGWNTDTEEVSNLYASAEALIFETHKHWYMSAGVAITQRETPRVQSNLRLVLGGGKCWYKRAALCMSLHHQSNGSAFFNHGLRNRSVNFLKFEYGIPSWGN